MRRFLIIAGISIILLGALATAGMMSSAGLRAMISLASALPAISLNVGSASGRLADEWKVEDVALEIPAAHITIDRLSVGWRPAELFQRKLYIGDISLQGLSVTLKPGTDDVPTAVPTASASSRRSHPVAGGLGLLQQAFALEHGLAQAAAFTLGRRDGDHRWR